MDNTDTHESVPGRPLAAPDAERDAAAHAEAAGSYIQAAKALGGDAAGARAARRVKQIVENAIRQAGLDPNHLPQEDAR